MGEKNTSQINKIKNDGWLVNINLDLLVLLQFELTSADWKDKSAILFTYNTT
jgi:hypothetical protein